MVEWYYVEGKTPHTLDGNSVYLKKGAIDGIVQGRFADCDIAVRSNIGIKRKKNQDSFGISPEGRSLVVPDGMGGYEDGESAAELASQSVARPMNPGEKYDLVARLLGADEKIKSQFKGAGAAIGAVHINERGVLFPYHVGDVRLYVFDENKKLRYITIDHSLVAKKLEDGSIKDEASFRDRNVILRAIGALVRDEDIDEYILTIPNFTDNGRLKGRAELFVESVPLKSGWRWMIADDGLHDFVNQRYIIDSFQRYEKAEDIVNNLVDMANNEEIKAPDNITIAVGIYSPTEEVEEETGEINTIG